MSKEGWTPTPRQAAYIQAHFECLGNKRKAAKKAKIPERTIYDWFANAEFREEIKKLEQEFADELVSHGLQLAKTGDRVLLIFFLKAFRPETYDDNIRKLKYCEERGIQPEKQKLEVLIRDATKLERDGLAAQVTI